MGSIMTSSDVIPCSEQDYRDLLAAIDKADAEAIGKDEITTGLSVDWAADRRKPGVYLYGEEDCFNLAPVLDSGVPAVVGRLLRAAGMKSLLCGVGWNEGRCKIGPTSGGYRFQFRDDDTVEEEIGGFPSEKWLWRCPACGAEQVVDYDALAAGGTPFCPDDSEHGEMERV